MPNEKIYRQGSKLDPLAEKVEYKELKSTTPTKSEDTAGADWIYITGAPTSFTPAAHNTSHQNGGSDEISVAGLSGLLADSQTPLAHNTSHKNGGSDEVATATAAANAIPKAGAGGTLAAGWMSGVLASTDLTNDAALEKTANKNAASGYAGLNSSSRTTKGVDTTDDIIVDLATKGLVLKDTAGTPHYWRVTIDTLGVLTTSDLGTTKP